MKVTRIPRLALWIIGLLALGITVAWAKKTVVDFGLDNTPPTNNANGEAWTIFGTQCTTSPTAPASCVLDFTSATNSGAVDIGFDVNIGGTKYTKIFVNKNGVLTFGAGLGAFAPVADFAGLTTLVGTTNPYIAAFYPNSELDLPLASSPSDLGFAGGAEYGRGTANPAGTDNGNNTDLSNNVAAFKATWAEPDDGSLVNPVTTRVVLYNTSAKGADGDFDIRIEYSGSYNNGTGKNGVVGFRLGSDQDEQIVSGSSSAPTPVTSDTDYYYHFCSGHLSTTVCAPAPPPPPKRCDVDHDGDIDIRDLTLIFDSLGRRVSAGDPRDANGNLRVDVLDLLICATRCTRKECAVK